ncbi:MAG: hypothetical protein M0Z36_04640 [Thermaerobacter sp.]|nr:hypothetical protein [Thermaerobacter sp.]
MKRTVAQRRKNTTLDPVMDTVRALIDRAQRAVRKHDMTALLAKARKMVRTGALIKKTLRRRGQIRVRAQRTPASHKTDSGGNTGPDPEPPRLYSLPALLVGGALV